MPRNKQLFGLLESLDLEFEVLTAADHAAARNAWCNTFRAPGALRRTSSYNSGFLWHTFSFELTRAETGRAALRAYDKERDESVFVIPGDEFGPRPSAVFVKVSCPLRFEPHLDYTVFPEDLAWTMSFTHEDGHGPYFTRAEWCRDEDGDWISAPRRHR